MWSLAYSLYTEAQGDVDCIKLSGIFPPVGDAVDGVAGATVDSLCSSDTVKLSGIRPLSP
jgi:hypothetical protein